MRYNINLFSFFVKCVYLVSWCEPHWVAACSDDVWQFRATLTTPDILNWYIGGGQIFEFWWRWDIWMLVAVEYSNLVAPEVEAPPSYWSTGAALNITSASKLWNTILFIQNQSFPKTARTTIDMLQTQLYCCIDRHVDALAILGRWWSGSSNASALNLKYFISAAGRVVDPMPIGAGLESINSLRGLRSS